VSLQGRNLVTDKETAGIRAAVMAEHPTFKGTANLTCNERIVVFECATQTVGQARPLQMGEMTANTFGYCNTAEAFIAIEVRCMCPHTTCMALADMENPLLCLDEDVS
jgi:hypothetical protein